MQLKPSAVFLTNLFSTYYLPNQIQIKTYLQSAFIAVLIFTLNSCGNGDSPNAPAGTNLFTLTGHKSVVFNAEWSPDGTKIATASNDITAIIWSTSGDNLFILKAHTDAVIKVKWSPDGTKVATASSDNKVMIWSATTGAKLLSQPPKCLDKNSTYLAII